VPFLHRFLEDLGSITKADRVHLIAHSMGNRGLAAGLERIAQTRASGMTKFCQVILAAPDIDSGVFRNLSTAIRSTAERITLYASSNDKALVASRRFHVNPRAGESGEGLLVTPGIDTVDVSQVNTGLLGHSFYGDNRSVVSDLFNVIRNELPPNSRPGLKERRLASMSYWVFAP
jgi:esterase/lipase superfamily enzyme